MAFREEVLNVVLASLLSKRGSLSVPEKIRSLPRQQGSVRRMPDVVVANFWGIRVVIEGRTFERKEVEETLMADSRRRVEEGVASICIAALYPPELRYADDVDALEESMGKTRLRVKVFNETGEGEWTETDVDGLSAILRRCYGDLVKEDILATVVNELDNGIEGVTAGLLESKANPSRLRDVLGIRVTRDE